MFPILTKSHYFRKSYFQAVTGKYTEGKKYQDQIQRVCSIEVLWPYWVSIHLAPPTTLSSFAFQICTSLLIHSPITSQNIPISLCFLTDDSISLV